MQDVPPSQVVTQAPKLLFSILGNSFSQPRTELEQSCLNMTKKLAAEIKLDRKAAKVFIA